LVPKNSKKLEFNWDDNILKIDKLLQDKKELEELKIE
jgi:hypothetical protein